MEVFLTILLKMVSMGWVSGFYVPQSRVGEPVTVHGGHDVVQVVHLVMIIPATRGDYGPIRSWSKAVWSIQRIRNSAVIQTMDVNDVERTDWHGVESS